MLPRSFVTQRVLLRLRVEACSDHLVGFACFCLLALACLLLLACFCLLVLACACLRLLLLARACLCLLALAFALLVLARACFCLLVLVFACSCLRACVLACLFSVHVDHWLVRPTMDLAWSSPGPRLEAMFKIDFQQFFDDWELGCLFIKGMTSREA